MVAHVHRRGYLLSVSELPDRVRLPLEEALAYLNEQPPRVTLAKGAIRAALSPEAQRWEDE